MTRLLAVLALFAFVGAAHGAGPSPGLLQGSTGITTPTQKYRFVTLAGPGTTTLAEIDKATGGVVRWRTLRGQWGIPVVAFDGTADGLTRDGTTLVVADWVSPENSAFRSRSSFRIYDANRLALRGGFTLRGDFSFDALSPDGGTLYLVQHLSEQDVFKYLVRAYDLRAGRLLPQAIADKRQQGWIMRGLPMRRLVSGDGRWVYTLYSQDGGYPFVHALDAANRRAVCIGIPWKGNQAPLGRATLTLADGKLLISAAGRQFAIDTETLNLVSAS
jgi:DNA-binding beta-propeller fold protein YncE